MTTKELIEKLQKFPEDAPLYGSAGFEVFDVDYRPATCNSGFGEYEEYKDKKVLTIIC